jgi:hypothetical protein
VFIPSSPRNDTKILEAKVVSALSHTKRVEQWYTHTIGRVNDWEKLRVDFYCSFNLARHIEFILSDICNFMRLEDKTIGAAWARFSHLLTSSPNMFIPDHSYLCAFYLSLDMGDTSRRHRWRCAHKENFEGREILDSLLENSFLLTGHNEPRQESKSIHESLSTAEPEPLTSTSQDSFVEIPPEPRTPKVEEIQP